MYVTPVQVPRLRGAHRQPNPTLLVRQRAWEEDVEADDDNDNAPSEAFISLQKDLEEKEKIQQENAERLKNEDMKAAEAAKSLRRKVKEQTNGPHRSRSARSAAVRGCSLVGDRRLSM